jgi:hypothetical protein
VFCCVARSEWQPERIVRSIVGAQEVRVRRIERRYGSFPASEIRTTSAGAT